MTSPLDDSLRAGKEPQEEPTDEQLVALLEAYEEQLIQGTASPVADWLPENLPPEVSQRLQRACRVLTGFDRARRLHQGGAPDTHVDADRVESAVFERLGRFEIIRELGRGAFGIVFLADDQLLRRQVALKVPRPEALLTPDSRRRFQREAQAAARLTHPNLIPVYETGAVGPICYIAAMYCDGPTLSSWLSEQTKPVSATIAAEIVAQLADGVAYAHSQGVLHRDIKPTNVLLEHTKGVTLAPEFAANMAATSEYLDFTPKLTDFGLAKIEELGCGETRTGAVIGTPAYMAPEQAAGRSSEIGPAADVYALGTLLYEILTRQAPFVGASDAGILHQVIAVEPTALHKIRRDVPADLEAICLKCLEKSPAARYASCAALADDLRRFIHGEPTRARPLSRLQRLRKWTRRNPATAALVVVSCLAALTIVCGSGAFSWRLAASLQESEERRVEAVAARTEAEKHRADALHERDANAEFLYAARMRQAFQILPHGALTQVAHLLAAYDDGTPYAGLRDFEWHYLKRSLHGERLTLTGHKGDVYSAAFSPNGRFLASAAEDGLIKLWDPASGQELRTIAAHGNCANDLSFSPDGRLLASASCDHTVKIWDTATWRELSSFTAAPQALMTSVAFSPDGRLLAAGDNGSGIVTVWDVATGARIVELPPTKSAVDAVAWSPDGQLLATTLREGGTPLWGTKDWQMVRELPPSTVVAFSPDSRLAATHRGHELRLSDTSSGILHSAIATGPFEAQKIAFGANGQQLFLCGSDGAVRIWTLADDGRVATESRVAGMIAPIERTLLGHTERVQGLAIASDARTLATASFDGTVRLWDLAASGGAMPVMHCPGVTASLSPPLDRLTMVTDDGQIVTWDTSSATVVEEYSFPKKEGFRAFGLSPNGHWPYAIHTDIDHWALRIGGPPDGLQFITKYFGRLEFSGDGCFVAAACEDGYVRVWDTQTREERCAIEFPHSSADETRAIAFAMDFALSGDGARLATTSTTFGVVDLETGRQVEIRNESAFDAGIRQLAFSPDGQLLAISRFDGNVSLVDCNTGRTLHSMRAPRSVDPFAFSPDGRTLAAGIETGLVMLWHVPTGQELTSFSSEPGAVAALRFSDDGRSLGAAIVNDGNAALYVWSSR